MVVPGAESIAAFTVHARTVPVEERSRFATHLHAELASCSVIVETCHRVEAWTAGLDAARIAATAAGLPAGGQILSGERAIRHAITVASGRDSVVVGEDQILHQLRASLAAARSRRAVDPVVDRLLAVALRAGRRTRSWQGARRRSLADLAIDVIEEAVGPVAHLAILVVGAGRMGALAARALVAAGASVTVANRSNDRARVLAATVGGDSARIDPGPAIREFAAVIVALGGTWSLARVTSAALVRGGALIVDLSVPAAVPGDLATALGDRLVSVDDLAVRDTADQVADPRTDALIEAAVREFVDWQAGGDARAAAAALVRRADREREAELAALWRRLPALEPEARDAIEGMTRRLATRLLRQPLERLGQDADGTQGRAVRDLFAL